MKAHDSLKISLIANYISFGLMAASGILINLILVSFVNLEMLGRFNLTYSLYIALSQVSVFGLQFSVLQKSSRLAKNDNWCSRCYNSAILCSVFISIPISIVLFLCKPVFSYIFTADYLETAIVFLALALPLYSLNKITLSYLNGRSRMIEYSFLQAARYVMLLSYIYYYSCGEFELNSSQEMKIYEVFLWVELSVFLLSKITLLTFKIVKYKVGVSKRVILAHVRYGWNAFFTGIVMELNTRVDVVTLSMFVSDYKVGIYSFLSTIAEGFYQLIVVLRNFINPKLTKIYFNLDGPAFKHLCFILIKRFLPLLVFIGGLLIISLKWFVDIAGLDENISDNSLVLVCLIFFIVVSSYSIIFEMMLNQCNRPTDQTKLSILVSMVNITLNIVLIPFFDILGAAIATGLSYCAMAYFLNYLLSNRLGVEIYSMRLSRCV